MKKTLFLTIMVLFGVSSVVLASGNAAQNLQDGRYAEDIEGDLDKAIGLYEKVIEDEAADAKTKAQAMYLQGMCYIKKQDESSAQDVLSRLVSHYPDQEQIVERAKGLLVELTDSDPAAIMPAETILYLELGSPGKQLETILKMLEGTPFENPLALMGHAHGGQQGGGQSPPERILSSLFNPSMMAEFKKIRGMAIGITEIRQNNPSAVVVLYPGKSDALRGLLMMGLGMVAQPAEAIEEMKVMNIMDEAGVAYDDKVIIVASPMSLLKKSINQYKGIGARNSLVSSNNSFMNINKKTRRDNALTLWVNVDEAYNRVREHMGDEMPREMQLVEEFIDPQDIDELLTYVSIAEDSINHNTDITFKSGHECLVYDLVRTPNLNRNNFNGVPSNAVAVFSIAMNESSGESIDRIRKPLERFTGLDIGRGLFSNLEQVTLFIVPNVKADVKEPAEIAANCLGLAFTSRNPAKTRQVWETVLGTADSAIKQNLWMEEEDQSDSNLKKYIVGGMPSGPLYCYFGQQGKTSYLTLSPDIAKVCMSAGYGSTSTSSGDYGSTSALTAGALSGPISKLSPNTSKLALINIGGAIKIFDAVTLMMYDNPKNPAHKIAGQLADVFGETYVQLRTDERPESLSIKSSLSNIPPIKDVYPLAMQLMAFDSSAKVVATNPRPGNNTTIKNEPEITLRWNPGAMAVSHKVYIGKDQYNMPFIAETKSNWIGFPTPDDSASYYWRVDEVWEDGSVVTGDTWKFIPSGKLVGQWRFDGNAEDAIGGNNGNTDNGPQWVKDGVIGGALQFDGEDDYVELPIGSLIGSLKSSTFSVWVNWTNTDAQWARIFDFGNGESNYMFLTPRVMYENQGMRFAMAVGGGYSDEDRVTAPMALPSGWHHVAVTIDAGNGMKNLYLDGKEIVGYGGMRFTPTSLGETARNFLGRSQFDEDPYFAGMMDDFRIYNYALSAKEIAGIYNEVKVVPEPVVKPETKTVSTVIKTGEGEVVVEKKVSTGETAGATVEATAEFVAEAGETDDSLIGWWKLDGNASDSAGGHDGELVNDPQWVKGKIGGALQFDGEDDFVALPIGSLVSKLDRATIMLWVNFSNEGGAWQRIFDFGKDQTNYIYLSPRTDASGPMHVAITAGEGEWIDLDADSGTLPSGWHHVAVVVEPDNMLIYLDGKVVGKTMAWYTLKDLGETTNNWLGRSQYPTDAFFKGSIDDLRIYNEALSAEQIVKISQMQ